MQPCSRPVTGGQEKHNQESKRVMFGCQSALGFSSISQVSSQVGAQPVFARLSPRERVDGYVHHERTSAGPGFGGCGWAASHSSANVAGDLILARINMVVPKEVTGATKARHDK